MVLEARDQHLIAGSDARLTKLCATRLMPSVALRVNTISRGVAALMKRCAVARALVQLGRPLAEIVNATMDVGVVLAHARHRLDHRRRLLRARRGIEEHQRPAVDGLLQAGESRRAPGRRPALARAHPTGQRAHVSSSSAAPPGSPRSAALGLPRDAGLANRSSTAPANAKVSTLRAVAGSSPRERR